MRYERLMPKRIVERNKRPGVQYAFTEAGVELPVIDVTHAAFKVSLGAEEQLQQIEAFMREQAQFALMPWFLRALILRVVLHGSVLAGSLRKAKRSFLPGLSTYLSKLGPENLGRAYTKAIDRKIAASLPALGMRLRLQDNAELLRDAVRGPLRAASTRALHLFNIAGGPAFDSLNALILLQREDPALLRAREVTISVLELEREGPAFGARALEALRAPGGPLEGLAIRLEHCVYDWAKPEGLSKYLTAAQADAVCAVSSEGGLFEYGSDSQILGNLGALRAGVRGIVGVVGSVTRADEPTLMLLRDRGAPTAKLHPRGLNAFGALIEAAGFRISRAIERPFCDDVLLVS
jgi:hypothetical protein